MLTWFKIQLSRPNSDYHIFNLLLFLATVALIIILKTNIVTVACPYAKAGIECPTCGLTRSFKSLLNGNITGINFKHTMLFILFTSQLIIRPTISYLIHAQQRVRLIRNTDIAISFLATSIVLYKLLT
jgi:hypothetical protein